MMKHDHPAPGTNQPGGVGIREAWSCSESDLAITMHCKSLIANKRLLCSAWNLPELRRPIGWAFEIGIVRGRSVGYVITNFQGRQYNIATYVHTCMVLVDSQPNFD